MSDSPTQKYISIDDYLLMEEEAEEKHEYYQGKCLPWLAAALRTIGSFEIHLLLLTIS